MIVDSKIKYLEFYKCEFGVAKYCSKSWGFASFQAGAQSKQAEIDSINTDLNHAFATVERQADEIDELRKRIDNALRLINKDISEFGTSNYLDNAVNVLKGTTNEQ